MTSTPVHAAAEKKVRYREVPSTEIKVSPREFEGEHLRIKDYFGRLLDLKKSRSDRRLWKRDWVKEQKIAQKDYLAFFTQRDGQGSNMLCYVPLSNKEAAAIVQGGLAEGDRVLLKGLLKIHEYGERDTDPDVTHFIVDSIQLEHVEEEKPVRLFVTVGKNRMQIPRTGEYNLFCPKCEKPVFTVRFHKLNATFDLKAKCPKCGEGTLFRFTNE